MAMIGGCGCAWKSRSARSSPHVRFLPMCPARLLDHLVGKDEEARWHREAERFGRLEVDAQLDFRGLLDRQVGRLLPLENPAGVDASQTVRICQTAAVAHQATSHDELA